MADSLVAGRGAAILSVTVAELGLVPAGDPVIVNVYVPAGKTVVVVMVSVDAASCVFGVRVVGERLIMSQGSGTC